MFIEENVYLLEILIISSKIFKKFISSYQVIFELDWILLMLQSRTKINSILIDLFG